MAIGLKVCYIRNTSITDTNTTVKSQKM